MTITLPTWMQRCIAVSAFALGASALAGQVAGASDAFPPARPEEVGVSSTALEALDAVVRGYVEREEIVGGELMVIAKRRTVWHAAHGWADRGAQVGGAQPEAAAGEAPRTLEPGSIYCVRSMTKPLIGTAIQMLVDDGRLSLDDPVAKFIPEFDHERHARITVRHLLEHTSGLPLSSLLTSTFGGNPQSIRGIRTITELAAKADLVFDPGAGFNYSDDGADTLTAIVEQVAGQPAEAFIRDRICAPLGMTDVWFIAPDDAVAASRFASGYGGSTGAWLRFWRPGDPHLFGCFLGSQGLYTSCAEYARLLCLWADDGKVGERRLLSHDAIVRGLAPAHTMAYPTGLAGASVFYGQMWMLWMCDDAHAAPTLAAFGHGGSDGTMAWMWPERDLIVLYFTQSRGGITGLLIEREIQRLLLGPADGESPATPGAIDPLAPVGPGATAACSIVGTYWDDSSRKPRFVFDRAVEHPGSAARKVALELPGRFVLDILPVDGADRWALEVDPKTTLTPRRDASGAVTGLSIAHDGTEDFWPVLAADASLPSVDDVVARVMAAHRTDRIGETGALRRVGTLDMPKLKRHILVTQAYSGTNMRVEAGAEGGPMQVTVSDGAHVWSRTGSQPMNELSGAMAEQALLEHPGRAFGDWRRHFRDVRVVARTTIDGSPTLLVRCVPPTCEAVLMSVDEASGRVVGIDRVVTLPGLGPIGASASLDDFRDVGGTLLPFHATIRYASPMLGDAETTIEHAEIVAVEPGLFAKP